MYMCATNIHTCGQHTGLGDVFHLCAHKRQIKNKLYPNNQIRSLQHTLYTTIHCTPCRICSGFYHTHTNAHAHAHK